MSHDHVPLLVVLTVFFFLYVLFSSSVVSSFCLEHWIEPKNKSCSQTCYQSRREMEFQKCATVKERIVLFKINAACLKFVAVVMPENK